jgi:hypothetical protein
MNYIWMDIVVILNLVMLSDKLSSFWNCVHSVKNGKLCYEFLKLCSFSFPANFWISETVFIQVSCRSPEPVEMAVAGVSTNVFWISFFSLPDIRFLPASSRSFFFLPADLPAAIRFLTLHWSSPWAAWCSPWAAERSREETENARARERAREIARDREELF